MICMNKTISNKISTRLAVVISAMIISSMVTQLVPAYVLATPASTSNQSIGQQIDSAITAIQGGNIDEGRKQLLLSKKLLEDMPSASAAEKHVKHWNKEIIQDLLLTQKKLRRCSTEDDRVYDVQIEIILLVAIFVPNFLSFPNLLANTLHFWTYIVLTKSRKSLTHLWYALFPLSVIS